MPQNALRYCEVTDVILGQIVEQKGRISEARVELKSANRNWWWLMKAWALSTETIQLSDLKERYATTP